MMDCVFCKIINGEIPAQIIYEDNNYIAFNDINPKMKTHILIIPKKHIERFDKLGADEKENLQILTGMFNVAYKLIKEKGLNGCKLQINCGKNHGQEVFHVHLHLMSNG